ncbi:MAG TPA: RDD family protein [Terriglobales bacterium]|nr:RDD family protein [Terriglobales bacterium]
MSCPHCQRDAVNCGCTADLLPPLPAWRYELQQRVDAYRTRRQRPAPARVLAFRPHLEIEAEADSETPTGAEAASPSPAPVLAPAPRYRSQAAAARQPEPIAEPVIAPPRARSLEPPLPAPSPVWEPSPQWATASPAAVQVPELMPEATLAEAVARPAPRRLGAIEIAWPSATRDAEPATFLQLPLPMWAPVAAAPPAPCPMAPRPLRLRAAAADAAVIGAAAVLFALAGWASLGMPAPDAQSWRHLLPALVAVPGVLAALYLLACAYLGGSTAGMRWFGLHVVGWDGQPAPAARLRRGWASVISLAALGLGYAWVFCDSQQLTWHDYISHTCVAEVAAPEAPPEPLP